MPVLEQEGPLWMFGVEGRVVPDEEWALHVLE
jgi:hypothetical protein